MELRKKKGRENGARRKEMGKGVGLLQREKEYT